MKYVVQDLADDGFWDERPQRFNSLQDAITEVGSDHEVQVVAIPVGEIVWRSEGRG